MPIPLSVIENLNSFSSFLTDIWITGVFYPRGINGVCLLNSGKPASFEFYQPITVGSGL